MEENNKLAVAEKSLQIAQEHMKPQAPEAVDLVERSAAGLAQASFKDLVSDFEFEQDVHNEIRKRLESASLPELMTLKSNVSLAVNDKLNRLINPVFNMLSTKIEAENRPAQKGSTVSMQNIQSLDIPTNVLQAIVDKSLDGEK